MSEPTTIQAGDSVAWSTSVPDTTPADGWALKYRLLWPGGREAVDIVPAAAGDGWTTSLSATVTAEWPAGTTTLVAWVEKSGARRTVGRYTVEILPDLATADAFDGRSEAVRGLADARKALADYMAGGKVHVAEYEIAGKRIKFRDADQITTLIGYYEQLVGRERIGAAILAGGSPGRVNVRF